MQSPKPDWENPVTRQRFVEDMKALWEKYGINTIVDMTAGYNGDLFTVTYKKVYHYTQKHYDGLDVDDVIQRAQEAYRKQLIDEALDKGDKDAFDAIMNPVYICADCDAKLDAERHPTCVKCGQPLCGECYRMGRGMCSDCEFPNTKRYDGIGDM